uniref:Putative lipocalin-2 1 n=1 Tax=Amblyomma triste TaxID=251400 RepID=A0A023GE69_AMBTT
MHRPWLGINNMHLFWFFLFLAAFVCYEVGAEYSYTADSESSKSSGLNIIEVFNTNNPLWRYRQTESNVETYNDTVNLVEFTTECAYVTKKRISNKKFDFQEKFRVNGDWLETNLTGMFDQEQDPPITMTLYDYSETDPSPFQNMTLLYSKDGCSVFKITHLTESDEEGTKADVDCEMYIREKKVSSGPPQECDTFFRDNCKEGHVVYESSCMKY